MRVLLPQTQFDIEIGNMAPRPSSLNGKVIGFLDGWGCRLEDGTFGMYPLMTELLHLLGQRFKLGGHTWLHKPNISKVAPPEQIEALLQAADAVINGECA